MTPIGTNEGEIYDKMSILALKAGKGCQVSFDELERITHEMEAVHGAEHHRQVWLSPENLQLVKTNEKLFKLIDWLKDPKRPKDDPCREHDVDQLNLQRNRDKAALQKRWFPNSPFTEVKMGYTQ